MVTLYERFDVSSDVVVELVLPWELQLSVRAGFASMPGLIARARIVKPMLDNLYPYAYPVCVCVCEGEWEGPIVTHFDAVLPSVVQEDYDHVRSCSHRGSGCLCCVWIVCRDPLTALWY